MKKLLMLCICLGFCKIYSQEILEKKITSKISEVTVFIKDAQVTRKKTVNLTKGESILKFINLSPFIDAKSVQVKANGNVMVLSVNHQQNYIDKLDKQQDLINLESKLKEVQDRIQLESTYLTILSEEIAFLNENRNIGGKNQELSVSNLKEASNFFGSKLTSLKLKQIERNKELKNLNEIKNDIEKQINTITSKKEYPNGEILVKVDSKNTTSANFELSYLVGNAGWFPNYDIRAKNIDEPIEIVYKANIKQDTKVDWNNVKLRLSSANPNLSGVAPELKTYYLNYNTPPPSYILQSNEITGKILDEANLPLPGVNIIVKGTTIGTQSDFDGNYSLTVPNQTSSLVFSYIGYKSKTIPISSDVMNVYMVEDSSTLDEVVVTAKGIKREKKALGYAVSNVKIRGASSLAIPSVKVTKQTTVDFNINIPYTIKSDSKSYSVDIVNHQLPANYTYYCVPKIDKDAFLIAEITDWEKYSFLEGEANIFFEDTYTGKTLLDVRYVTDTLKISLGRDKNVIVKREKIKDFTTKQFLGNKKVESRGWDITIKNNKNEPINLLIFDQVPVSTLEEIEVKLLKISGAKHNSKTGEIKWNFKIAPNEVKKAKLNYSVKYPKSRQLIIE